MELIAILIVAGIVGFAIYKAKTRKQVKPGGPFPPDEPEKPSRPIDRR